MDTRTDRRKRIAQPAPKNHPVDAEPGGIAEDRAEIFVVVDPFEHSDRAGALQHLRNRRFHRTAGGGKAPRLVKAHHVGHHLRCRPVAGHIETWEATERSSASSASRRSVPSIACGGEPGGEHAPDHQNPSAITSPYRWEGQPTVDTVEVAKVVDPRVIRVGDVDDRLHVDNLRPPSVGYGDRNARPTSLTASPERSPALPAALLDPRPVILAGAVLWLLAAWLSPFLHCRVGAR